jgi:para-nitrobenzyl esterase
MEECDVKGALILLLALAGLAMAALQEPVRVEGGQITGTPTIQWSYGVRLYRAIPYAAPPTGELRWRPPLPVTAWQGVKAADHFSPVCMQAPPETEGNAWREGHYPISEDCLYLNVWTPAKTNGDKLPVMVFIHGGGNTRGAASENQYDGAYLAKKGVVFVSFNYRMGAFGFMAHPGLTAESDHHSSGNYAILDQIAALQWIQRNISNFGGDPGNVMIFGHSAGAANVCSLVATPLAKGLFHRALAQSGNCLNSRTVLPDAEKNGVKFAESLGASSIAALRQKTAAELLKAPRGQLGTNVDGWVFPQDAYSIIAAGKHNDVPLIVGTVADDAAGPGTGPVTAAQARTNAQNTYKELAGKYLKLYPAGTDKEAAQSAYSFRVQNAMANARGWAQLQAKAGKSKVYWYYFTHTSPMPEGLVWGGRPAKSWGAYHGSEIVYVFNAFPLQDWTWRPVDLKLGDAVSSIWVNFVKTGSPNGPGLPEWPAYEAKSDMVMNFGDSPKAQIAPMRDALQFIAEWTASQRK